MKSLFAILLSACALLTSCAVDQYKITPRVIKSQSELPSTLKPGTYSEQQMKGVYLTLSKTPDLDILTAPSLVMKTGNVDKAGAILIGGGPEFTGIQLMKKNQSLILDAVYQGSNPKETIQFNDPIVPNESIIKMKGNTAVIIGLEKAE